MPSGSGQFDPLAPKHAQFTTTHWTVILHAVEGETAQAREALEQLCRTYWYPLYAYTRRRGYAPEDAQDLTQGFFERLVEKNYVHQADRQRGKFRTFLLVALGHYLADQWNRAHRIKRGGSYTFLALDGITAEERYKLEPVDRLDAARLYERKWATALLERALKRLEEDFATPEQESHFRELSQFLLGEQREATYSQVAPRMGMSEGAVKMAVSRMRARYRELLRQEILRTVSTPEEAEEEYRALRAALRE